MKILIIGGTRFLGRHLAEMALERGHELTLFNRGVSNPELFPSAEHLKGDRDEGLDVIKGKEWDAVIDTCGYFPRQVKASAKALADSVKHYTFISSISVYPVFDMPGINEETPVGTIEDETVEEITGGTYGPLKALCEQAVESIMPLRVLNVRPGLIVGPHDTSDRFAYWVKRIGDGGRILLPDIPDSGVQMIDVRDLSVWILDSIESRRTGVFNVTSEPGKLTFHDVIKACQSADSKEVELEWVGEDFLIDHEVQPWMEMPLWIPTNDDDSRYFAEVSVEKALKAGLKLRPLSETIADTQAWLEKNPIDRDWRAGITRERETDLLEQWDKIKEENG